MSRAIATTILRKFSACRSSFEVKLILRELGDAVDEEGDLVAELALDVRRSVASVSSTTSWRSPAQTLAVSSLSSVMIPATLAGWMKYGSPILRCLPRVRSIAVVVRALDELGVGRGLVRPDAIDEIRRPAACMEIALVES